MKNQTDPIERNEGEKLTKLILECLEANPTALLPLSKQYEPDAWNSAMSEAQRKQKTKGEPTPSNTKSQLPLPLELEDEDTPKYCDIVISHQGAVIMKVLNADSLEDNYEEGFRDVVDAQARRFASFLVIAVNNHIALAEAVLKTAVLDHREICGCAHKLEEAVMPTPEMPPCTLAVAILAARQALAGDGGGKNE